MLGRVDQMAAPCGTVRLQPLDRGRTCPHRQQPVAATGQRAGSDQAGHHVVGKHREPRVHRAVTVGVLMHVELVQALVHSLPRGAVGLHGGLGRVALVSEDADGHRVDPRRGRVIERGERRPIALRAAGRQHVESRQTVPSRVSGADPGLVVSRRAGHDVRSQSSAPAKPCCRQASNVAIEAALARFSDRRPGCIGRRTVEVIRSWSRACCGNPVASQPNSSTSPGR